MVLGALHPACELCSLRAFHVWLLRPKTSWICFSHRCFPRDEPLEARNARIAQTKRFLKPNSGAGRRKEQSWRGCLDPTLGLSKDPLEKDGKVVKGKSSKELFFGSKAKTAPGEELRCIGAGGRGIWDCLEGLELSSKTFHDALRGKEQGNGFGRLLFCLNPCLGSAGGFFGVAAVLPG